MYVELTKSLYFDAAHRNPNGGEAQARLHGHSYRIDLVVAGDVDPKMDWLLDFADIKRAFRPLADQLDHHDLNDVEGLADPSLAGVGAWIFDRLSSELPCLKDVRVSILGDCAFKPVEVPPDDERGVPARIRFTFEAAQYLPQLPEAHPCSRLHGHSYRLEVGARALDRLMPELEAVYDALDHHCLNDVPGLEHATCEVICVWLWERLSKRVDDLAVVIVQETDTARCVYRGP